MRILWHQIEKILQLCGQLILEIINFIGKKFSPNFDVFRETKRFNTFFRLVSAIKELVLMTLSFGVRYLLIIWNWVIGILLITVIVIFGYIIIEIAQKGESPAKTLKKSMQHFLPHQSVEFMNASDFMNREGLFTNQEESCFDTSLKCKVFAFNPLKLGFKIEPDDKTKLEATLKSTDSLNIKNMPKKSWTKLYILDEFQSVEIDYQDETNFEPDTCRWIFTHQDKIIEAFYIEKSKFDCKAVKYNEISGALTPQTLNLQKRSGLWFNLEKSSSLSPISQSQED